MSLTVKSVSGMCSKTSVTLNDINSNSFSTHLRISFTFSFSSLQGNADLAGFTFIVWVSFTFITGFLLRLFLFLFHRVLCINILNGILLSDNSPSTSIYITICPALITCLCTLSKWFATQNIYFCRCSNVVELSVTSPNQSIYSDRKLVYLYSYIYREHPWYSGSALDSWTTG